MKKWSKWSGVAATVVMSAGLTAGCGSTGSNSSNNASTANGTSSSSKAPVTLTLGMWASSPAEKQLVQNQVNEFEKQNPNITVKLQVITGNYLQELQPMLASKTAPDIFYVDSSYAPQLEDAGALMPLDNYIKQDNVDTSDFSASLLKAFQWKGVTYGLPKDFNTLALEYNKSLFAQAGISTPPTTWDEFQQDAQKLEAKNIVPMSFPIDVARFYPFIKDMGGSFYDDSANKATFTDSSNNAGLKFVIDMFQKKYFETAKDQGGTWAGDPFSQGKVAMAAEGAWIIPALQQTAPKLDYGISDFPTLNGNNFNMVYTVSYSMAKSTKHPDEAAKLLFFMTGKDAEKMTAQSGLAMPSRTSQQSVFLAQNPSYKAFVDGVPNAIPYQFGTLGQNFVDAINNATEAGVLKNVSPTDVLKQADSTLSSQSQ